jgi:GNAT superfamily N-acetyltransferase
VWGLQVLHVNTAGESRAVVDALEYAPEGRRGFFCGDCRARYGHSGTTADYANAGRGVATALLREVERVARGAGCRRLWLITTNDNLTAIEFYRRRGWRQVAIHRGAVVEARRLKPEIPELGANGLPKIDGIDFELPLHAADA